MASYGCDYKSDFGKVYRHVKINSRFYTADGTRSRTSKTFDLPYLPSVFIEAVNLTNNCSSCCSLIIKPRAVKLWLDEDKYLYLEYPFEPTSSSYLAFMTELNNNSRIILVERVGEKLDNFYTDFLT